MNYKPRFTESLNLAPGRGLMAIGLLLILIGLILGVHGTTANILNGAAILLGVAGTAIWVMRRGGK